MGLKDPEMKKLRALKLIEAKVTENLTTKELAERFHISMDTVDRTLSWAKRADIFANYEDKIIQELIPLAHEAIKSALIDGNAKIAVQVFKGLNLLKTNAPTPSSPTQRVYDDDLAGYIAKKRDLAQLRESAINGEIIPPEHPFQLEAASDDRAGEDELSSSLETPPEPSDGQDRPYAGPTTGD